MININFSSEREANGDSGFSSFRTGFYNWINSCLGLRLLTIIDVVKDLY